MPPNNIRCSTCDMIFSHLHELRKHKAQRHPSHHVCNYCGKKFGRKDNCDRHEEKHRDIKQFQCSVCNYVSCRKDTIERHYQRLHGPSGNQAGGGQHVTPGGATTSNPKFSIRKIKETNSAKFRAKSTYYEVTFADLEISETENITKYLESVIRDLLEKLTATTKPIDLITLSVECPDLDFPIIIPFVKVEDMTVERFLAEITRVLQSYQDFTLDSALKIKITHVSLPDGSGRSKKQVNLAQFLRDKQCIIRIKNEDILCCSRAIVTAKARLDKHPGWNSIRRGYSLQENLAKDLHEAAGVSLGPCGLTEVKKFQEVMQGYQIYVISKDYFNAVIYAGPQAEKKIFIYHHDQHFDVITSMPAFCSKNYFCTVCYKGYDHKEEHGCVNVCRACYSDSCIVDQNTLTLGLVYCKNCNRTFQNNDCFQNHAKLTKYGNSICRRIKRCRDCGKTIDARIYRGQTHVCGDKYCKVCDKILQADHLCYIQVPENKMSRKQAQADNCSEDDVEYFEEEMSEDQEDDKEIMDVYIFCDFECLQGTDGIHQPNLCIAQRQCNLCMDGSAVIGSECLMCTEKVFSGPESRDNFCQWLFSEENSGSTVLFHNFKGYDSFFVMEYLYQNAVLPRVICQGTKILTMTVPACGIRFIDSINFLPMALSKLSGTFQLPEAKGYFPHLYSTLENQDARLDHLPEVEYYQPDTMKPDERKKFLEWYETHKNEPFNLQEKLIEYCRADVNLLRSACVKFRQMFMDMTALDGNPQTGIDPFKHCVTIASACNLVFRTRLMKPGTIAVIPPNGYRPEQTQSIMGLKWLMWLAKSRSITIQHARNGGEYSLGDYKLDGYHESGDQRTAYEFHGGPKHYGYILGQGNSSQSRTVCKVKGII